MVCVGGGGRLLMIQSFFKYAWARCRHGYCPAKGCDLLGFIKTVVPVPLKKAGKHKGESY